LLQPVECSSLRRLGSRNDGGYVVPVDAIQRASALLSFGVATNWDFEVAAAKINPGLAVYAFDPSVGKRYFSRLGIRAAVSAPLRLLALSPSGARSSARKAKIAADYFRFFSGARRHYEQRVWNNADRGSAAIAEVISGAGTTRPLSLFAKIDIEGSEYRILPDIIARGELFTGLVVEFHDTDICAEIFNRQIAHLKTRFEIVHVHGNNYGDLSVDRALPLTLEITFLNRALADAPCVPYRGSLPRPGLDAPNDPRRPDYTLRLPVGD
jgi:hypothetical protein